MKNKVIKIFSGICVVLFSAIFFFFGSATMSFDMYNPIDPHVYTKLSATFDLEYFKNIKEGDDVDEVIKRLGKPFEYFDYMEEPSYLFSSDGKFTKWKMGFAWIGYHAICDSSTLKVKETRIEIHQLY